MICRTRTHSQEQLNFRFAICMEEYCGNVGQRDAVVCPMDILEQIGFSGDVEQTQRLFLRL